MFSSIPTSFSAAKTATKPKLTFRSPYTAVFDSVKPLYVVVLLALEILLNKLACYIARIWGCGSYMWLDVQFELPTSSSGIRRYSLKRYFCVHWSITLNLAVFLFSLFLAVQILNQFRKEITCKSSVITLQSHTRYSPLCAPYTWDLKLTTYFKAIFSVDDRFLLEGSALLWPLMWPLMWRK